MKKTWTSYSTREDSGNRPPISKKAPGDRQFTDEEIRKTAALIMEKKAEGKVSNLPGSTLRKILSILRKRPAPPILEAVDPGAAVAIGTDVARVLRRKEIRVRLVDLGDTTGFPRDNARPSCEVMLVEKDGELLWSGRKDLVSLGGIPTIYITSGFYTHTRKSPGLLLQAILHPVLEWVLDFPHMLAVLCESAYDDTLPDTEDDTVSDLNRFIVGEAARDRDFSYFDRVLGTKYEPDEFRMEELNAYFGEDVEKRNIVIYHARTLGDKYRKLMEDTLSSTREEISSEEVAQARNILNDGDPERALTILRKLKNDPAVKGLYREEVDALIDLSIRCYAIDADPAYEGLRLERGEIHCEPWAGRKARQFSELLRESVETVRSVREKSGAESTGNSHTDPLGEKGSPRIIHVIQELERPSGKFIDGHDNVHWVFERSFVDALLSGHDGGRIPRGISAIMACRFVRDGAFPDEKLKIDKQYAVAVKGALEGYRFFQSLPQKVRGEMAAFYESSGTYDPLYRLFLSLGEETNVARASHMIRDAVSMTHSFNYVRYPDTSLAGKVIVITGAGTGMGRALALEGAIRSANVVVTGRRPAPLEETCEDMEDLIRHLGLSNRTLAVQGDVSDPKYVGEMFDRISREFGRIDILYNNAGVSGPVEFGSMYQDEHFDQYQEAMNIHLTGAWLASQEAAKKMETQPDGGLIVMVGTFYSESIHRHVLHAYPGRLPYTSAQSAKLALGDYLAWVLSEKNITVLSLNPSAVYTERIQRGAGVFDKGAQARARVGRHVSPESLERDTLDRTVSHEFVLPRDFARVALDMHRVEFRRTVGGQRIAMGGVTYEQPPGVIPSPAGLERYPDMVGKVVLLTLHRPFGNDRTLLEAAVRSLAHSGASIVLAGNNRDELESLALHVSSAGYEGMATVYPANLRNLVEVQELFNSLKRIDLLLHFTGSVDWKHPLTNLPVEEWTATVDRFGIVPRILFWQAEKRMDRDGIDGTIALVGPDLSGVPSIRERDLVQVFQAMLRPAVATESMERALMGKAHAEKTSPTPVSKINIGLILPGRTDGRNKQPDPGRTAASILWLLDEGKKVSGAVLLPDEQNSLAHLPAEPMEAPGSLAGKVVAVTGGIRGLGKEISLCFAAEKATVVAASRRPVLAGATGEEAEKAKDALEAGNAVLASMRSVGAKSFWMDVDVSRYYQVQELIDEIQNRLGRIDVFINNAGAGGDFSLIENVMRDHRQSWESVLRSNFLGPWFATSLLKNIMAKQEGGGAIVNVSTHYADHPYLFRTIYTVSKIALKALTLALHGPLAADDIFIADLAPSLIAGPRMGWVMRNYAETFASQFDQIPEFPPKERKKLRNQFVLSFDRAHSAEKRNKAAASFLATVQESRLPKSTQAEMESWYGRIKEWFRSTVPDHPPTNEQVVYAVVYGGKNARFLEDRFIGVSSLPTFESFPPEQKGKKRSLSEKPYLVFSMGDEGTDGSQLSPLGNAIAEAGGKVTQIMESQGDPGRAHILRPSTDTRHSGGKASHERITRDLELSDPRVIEPWFDNSLLGGPPNAGAVLHIGKSGPEKPILDFTIEEMEVFLAHLSKVLSAFGEALRTVKERGDVVVIVPSPQTEEGHMIRATVRQMVRTALAEQHFLFPANKVRISLLTEPDTPGERDFQRRILDILSGQTPAQVEPIPVGRLRP